MKCGNQANLFKTTLSQTHPELGSSQIWGFFCTADTSLVKGEPRAQVFLSIFIPLLSCSSDESDRLDAMLKGDPIQFVRDMVSFQIVPDPGTLRG